MNHTIVDNGIDTSITEEQAKRFLEMNAIYECDECGSLDDECIYHVWPDTELEDAYQDCTYPFEELR